MGKQLTTLQPHDRLTLHNLMLMIALEEERITKYQLIIEYAGKNLNKLRKDVDEWTKQYAAKLKDEKGVDISNVAITPEDGIVTLIEGNNNDNTSRCG